MSEKLLPANTTPAMLDLYKLLLKSEKFLNWNKTGSTSVNPKFGAEEKHFTPHQLAEAWGVDVETIRNIFRDEPGVLKISNASKLRTTLRIPKEIAERVHRRLAA
jgi:hypothetical protein